MNNRLADLWSKGGRRPPLIVAELSGNHNQSLARALELVDAAAECGVDAIKLQTYTPDTITLDATQDEFTVDNPGSVWHGRRLHDLYAEAHTPWEWHQALVARAALRGLDWFSSPFDHSAVVFLEALDVPCYKIASPELVDLPLITRCAATGKPLIISTGMATLSEIGEAVATARQGGCERLLLLKCTTDYPAAPENSNLATMRHMSETFQCPVGASDHTPGIGAAVAAAALGAAMIEKHFTLRRSDGGPDSHFSLEPSEMTALVIESKVAWLAIGDVSYGPQDAESGSLRGRRSLYVVQDMKAGDVFTPQNLRSIRPGFGLAPKYYETFLGKAITRDAPKGSRLTWDMIAS